ncbi:glutathione peroxidase [Bdellovibrionota bacterium FG-2]
MSIYDTEIIRLSGEKTTLAPFRGQVLLIVNVASHCGFTPQYKGLEALYGEFRAQGFAVLGFPCNQFGAQEPGTADEIQSFCTTLFGVEFPMFSKIEVNGPSTHPMYQHLKKSAPGVLGSEAIKCYAERLIMQSHVFGELIFHNFGA